MAKQVINYVCVLCLKLLTAACSILVTSRQVNLFNLVNSVELDKEISKSLCRFVSVSFGLLHIWRVVSVKF